MAHHEHRLVLVDLSEIVLQPFHGVEVEVVGGLVEQQVVGFSEEGFCQHDAHLLVVGEGGHLLVVGILLHAEVLQQLGCVALSLPSVHLGKLLFELGCAVAILLGHLCLRVESLALLHVVPERLMTHENGVHHAVCVILKVVLLEHRQAFAWAHLHSSFVWLQVSTDGAQEG